MIFIRHAAKYDKSTSESVQKGTPESTEKVTPYVENEPRILAKVVIIVVVVVVVVVKVETSLL